VQCDRDAMEVEITQVDVSGLRELLTKLFPFTMGFVDLTNPLEVWNYGIMCFPYVFLLTACIFPGVPHVLNFIPHAIKALSVYYTERWFDNIQN